MHTIIRSRQTKHAPETIWEALASFNEVYRFHPAVDRSPGTARDAFAVGAQRTCHFSDGNSVEEEVVAFEQGRSLEIAITRASMPIKSALGRLEITPSLGGATVSMTMNFEPKYGILGDLMARLMMKPMLTKMIDSILQGLDDHLRTGQDVGPSGQLLAA